MTEHECEYKLIMESQDSNMKRLIADLKQAEAQLGEAREEIKKLEEEILACPADVAYHATEEK